MLPTPRREVYDTYWYFAAERHAIFERRLDGGLGPWTDDPILARYKFCNTFRASDRVSQFLIRDVIYRAEAAGLPADDAFLRIVLFRLFSKEATWRALEPCGTTLRRRNFDPDRLGDALSARRARSPIYTAAFILSAHDAFGHHEKHRNHLALVESMFRPRRLGREIARARSLREIYEALLDYPGIGPFLAYQIAIDLLYSPHLDFSENDFTVPGPGAIRGLYKVFSDFGTYAPSELVMLMVERQHDEFDGRGFGGLFGRRPLHAIDCQGLFCESDKYARAAFPHLKSNRVRIKQPFTPSSEPLELFYPPKWGLNDCLSGPSETALVA
jgi:hypothetical protein